MESVHEAARPPNTVWHFRIGQCVTRKDEIFPALIMDRAKTRRGLQIYSLRAFTDQEERRDRRVIGGYLMDVAAGTEPCQACLLHKTSACPSA